MMLADVVRILRGLNPPGAPVTIADVIVFLRTYTKYRDVLNDARSDPSLAAEIHALALQIPEPSS